MDTLKDPVQFGTACKSVSNLYPAYTSQQTIRPCYTVGNDPSSDFVSCLGINDSDFTNLLKIVARDDSIQFNANQQVEASSEEVYHPPPNPNLDKTYFCTFTRTRQVKASEVRADDYPWVARVFHSPDKFQPLICTAFALRPRVFATAARCIATAKCRYTSLDYKQTRLTTKAFVFPTKSSTQWFDDIGLIVVADVKGMVYSYAPLFDRLRSGDNFQFLDEWHVDEPTNTVIGYIPDEQEQSKQRLYALRNVYVSNYLCNKIYPVNRVNSNDYYVPCVHSCTPKQYYNSSPVCEAFMAGLGHVVLDKADKVLGIATWACETKNERPLPVGLAVVNSKVFQATTECAMLIAMDASNLGETGGRFQDYCTANSSLFYLNTNYNFL